MGGAGAGSDTAEASGVNLLAVTPGLAETAETLSMIWPWLALASVVLVGLGLLLGRASRPKARDNAEAIWEAINTAAKVALTADATDLQSRADALRLALERRLGGTARVMGGQSSLYKALVKALEGRTEPADSNNGEIEGASGARTQVVVITGGTAELPSATPNADRGARDGGFLSPRARDQALLLAVSDISQHWRQKSARLAELRAAHRELSRT